MAITVKEMKDDAIVQIKVNKSFYLMCKAASFYIIQQLNVEGSDPSQKLQEIMTKEYKDLDDVQRTFYTLALLLAEIETQTKETKLYDEKEVLEPGDEGYEEPIEEN